MVNNWKKFPSLPQLFLQLTAIRLIGKARRTYLAIFHFLRGYCSILVLGLLHSKNSPATAVKPAELSQTLTVNCYGDPYWVMVNYNRDKKFSSDQHNPVDFQLQEQEVAQYDGTGHIAEIVSKPSGDNVVGEIPWEENGIPGPVVTETAQGQDAGTVQIAEILSKPSGQNVIGVIPSEDNDIPELVLTEEVQDQDTGTGEIAEILSKSSGENMVGEVLSEEINDIPGLVLTEEAQDEGTNPANQIQSNYFLEDQPKGEPCKEEAETLVSDQDSHDQEAQTNGEENCNKVDDQSSKNDLQNAVVHGLDQCNSDSENSVKEEPKTDEVAASTVSENAVKEDPKTNEVAASTIAENAVKEEPKTNEVAASTEEMTPALKQFGTDMNDLARKGKLDPVAARQSEIKRMIMILSRRRKNNPCLIGEPGVGKTAIVEGLAQRIIEGKVPQFLRTKRVISIDIGLVQAGSVYAGQFEEKMMKLIGEAKENTDVILFFDELHTLIGAGKSTGNNLDAAQWLKPALARGELQCIGATTVDEYRKYIEEDKALERRFQPVKVLEPSIEETVGILKELQRSYEEHHSVRFTDAALVAAAKLSHRFISDRFLPDKAIDLIDEAAANLRLKRIENTGEDLREVTEDDIAEAVSSWTGIPSEKMSVDESGRLRRLEDTLRASVVGQDEALVAISRAMRRARAGLRNPNRPIASLIFCGPTGVGKTELAKALAASYFGSDEAMIRLDMSEYMEGHSFSRLIGSPPGYLGHDDGGQLTEAVRRRPHSLVLHDEIEKAHQNIYDVMLQIMDDGRLTDGKGRTVDFKNTMLIMTSNIGSHAIENGNHNRVMGELQKVFRPEFLNRVDETIAFRQLTLEVVQNIAGMMLKEVGERLTEKRKIERMDVTERFKERVIKEGYDPKYGARALRRAVTRLLEDNLADKIFAGEINEGDVVTVDVGVITGNILISTQHNIMICEKHVYSS